MIRYENNGRHDEAARSLDRERERARGRAEAERRDTGDEHEDHVADGGWDSALFARLLGYLRGHRGLFVGSFLTLLAVFALQLLAPMVVGGAVDGPIEAAVLAREAAQQAGETFDATPFRNELLRWTGLYLLLLLAGLGTRYLEVKQLARAGQAVIHDLRQALFGHMQGLHLGWFDRYPSGSLVTRVTSDIENLSEMFTAGIVQMAFDLSKIAVLFVVLYWLHPGLATVVLVMTPLFLLTSLFFRGGARRSSRRVRSRLSRLNGFLAETLLGMRVVQAFGREARVQGRFAALLERYFQANLKAIFFFAAFFASIGVVNAFTQGAMVRVGGPAIQSGSLTYGEFMMFWLYLNLLLDPIRELGERYNILQSAFASAERVFDILDTEPRVEDRAGLVPASLAERRSPRLAFEDVSFRYARGAEVLRDVSFAIEPGQTVAVVGATGAGKSTLVNLLLRFYDPTPGEDEALGRVTMDGVDLKDLDLGPWRERLGLVLQEDFLFAGTARENLTLGRDGAAAGLDRALATSAADKVVAGLPEGLDTHLGERGARLSTGQRELFAIARALAADPLFVILDEATASVDSATEAAIEEATGELLAGRSAFVVAHRLSTIRRADKILVMHHGRLVESGTHEELVAQGGVYARLVTMQFHDA